eukprot:COSAG02_NODE_8257_length_2622_cov_1.487795_5_plen_57_part_00
MFMIVLCANSIEWAATEPADRLNTLMASLLTVVALKVPLPPTPSPPPPPPGVPALS